MNKKITYVDNFGKREFFVISPDEDCKAQLEEEFNIQKGHGLTVEMNQDVITIRDYFAGEDVANLKILSIEDTDLDVFQKG